MIILRGEVMFCDDGFFWVMCKVFFFGAVVIDNYKMLYEVEFVYEKVEGVVFCNIEVV